MKRAIALLFLVWMTLSHDPALAQDYPLRPIRVLIPFPPGGGSDIASRTILELVARQTDLQFVAENRAGAGGNIAFTAAAAAAPDGYTLLFATPGLAINPSLYRSAGFTREDFTPIALVAEAPLVLMVRPTLAARSVQDLVALSRAAPDAIKFGSAGNGSSSHLATEVLKSMTDLQVLHVPYKSSIAAMSDVVAGRIDMTVQPLSESIPFVRDGRMRALALTGAKRSPALPDVPTMQEQGVAGYSVATWYMLVGPAHLPAPIVARLHDGFAKVLAMPSTRETLADKGIGVINDGPEQARTYLDQQTKRWAAIIQQSAITVD